MMFLNKTYAIAVILSLVLSPALAASTGIDTASGSTTLPFSIESNTVMNLKSDGLHFESGKSINVDTANIGTVAYVDGSRVIKLSDIPTCSSTQYLQFDGTNFTCTSTTEGLKMLTGTGCSSCPHGTISTSTTSPFTYDCTCHGKGCPNPPPQRTCTSGDVIYGPTYCSIQLKDGSSKTDISQPCHKTYVYTTQVGQAEAGGNKSYDTDWTIFTY